MDLKDEKLLPLQLFAEGDSAEAIEIKSRLEPIVNSSVTPSQAAVDFDAWVTSEAERRLEIFSSRTGPARYDPTSDEVAQGIDDIRSIGPNPQGHINQMFEGITKLCSSFPPFHATQDLMISFFEALRALPPHDVPNVTPLWRLYDGSTGGLAVPDHPGWDMMRLWAFTDAQGDLTMLVKDRFRDEAESVYSYESSDIETTGSELRLRWRNFQSFAARLTTAGLVDCKYNCALRDMTRHQPDPQTMYERNRITAHATAGAQWVLRPDIGRWVYAHCKADKSDEYDDNPWGVWNLEGWKGWREHFLWIAGDERFDGDSRAVARLASQQMEAYEAEG